jgi:hypothetical protein
LPRPGRTGSAHPYIVCGRQPNRACTEVRGSDEAIRITLGYRSAMTLS